jgi:cation:H+ antiporter
VIYFISLKFLSSDDAENDDEDTSPLTVKQIVVRFVLMAMGLVTMSIVVTFFTDMIQEKLNLGASIAGALFLGIVTSLPELTSSITLVRHKNFNAMAGNVVGSNMFNFTILSIADFIAGNVKVYPEFGQITLAKVLGDDSAQMIMFGLVSTAFVAVSILMQSKCKQKNPLAGGKLGIYVILGLGVVASYLISNFI